MIHITTKKFGRSAVRMLKIMTLFLVGAGSYTASAQVLLSGTSFDPKIPGDTSRAFWGINDILYTGMQGGDLTIVPPLTPNVNANVFNTTYYHAITNNPNKLDRTRYQNLRGTARDNMLVVSPTGTMNTPILNYNVSNLLPGSNVEFRVTYCNVSSIASCGVNGNISSLKGVINPANSGDGFEAQPQLRSENCLDVVYRTGPPAATATSGSRAVGANGQANFSLNNFLNIGDCKVIGIKSIEVWGTPKPKIFASVGAEVCKGEQLVLSATQQYTGVTYQWQVRIGAGAWSNITGGTGPTAVYEALTAPTSYQFQLIVRQGASTFTSDAIGVNSIVCCEENGFDASRQTIFYDNFGRIDPADNTGSTYIVWDYNNLVNGVPTPIERRMTTTTPFRWPLANPPLGATFRATGAPVDGQYVVAGYITGYGGPVNGYAGAALEWAARVKGPINLPTPELFYDHTGDFDKDPFGAALFLNCPENTLNQVLYTRDISNLCNQKKLFFEAWIAVFTNSATGSTYHPVNVKVRLTELDAGGNPTANIQETTATATREANGGGVWVPIRRDITLGTGTSFRLELINNQNVSVDGNDLMLDDIKVMACAPPSISAYFNTALAQTISVCPANSDPVPLLTLPSAMLNTYYSNEANSPQFLFQWTRTPNDVTSWKNIGTPNVSDENIPEINSASHEAFTGLLAGGKVYFRVIAASPTTFTDNFNFQGAGNEANINKPCKNYSVSGAIEATIACTLPVNLLSFTAEQHGASNLVQWSTVTERNNDYFVVERSLDGRNFEELGTVKGYGNSNTLKSYQYVDRLPYEATNYYRLKQTDWSGKVTYSKVVSVRNTLESSEFTLYPNPNKGAFTVKVAQLDLGAKVEIMDLSGKLIYQTTDFSENGTVEILGLTEGVYFVKVLQDAQVLTKKVVVY